jgi:hypothetical protein
MPLSTEGRIDQLCVQIKALCAAPLSREAEDELRKLTRELRRAINDHLKSAKSSLKVKGVAIAARDSY